MRTYVNITTTGHLLATYTSLQIAFLNRNIWNESTPAVCDLHPSGCGTADTYRVDEIGHTTGPLRRQGPTSAEHAAAAYIDVPLF